MTAEDRRQAYDWASARGVSCRRSSFLVSLSDSSKRYKSKKAFGKSEQVSALVEEFGKKYPRLGYRKICNMIRTKLGPCNYKAVYRIWKEKRLQVPRKPSYRRKYGHKNRRMSAICPNAIWAFDFVHDECANGQKLKIFAVKDEYTREALAVDVAARFRSQNVVETLNRLVACYGTPTYLRCDNGPEFIAETLRAWAANNAISIAYVEPGKPWQNGSAESFNSRLQDELLQIEWFKTRAEARVLIEAWRVHYNTERPHQAIAYLTPSDVRNRRLRPCQLKLRKLKTSAA